MLSSYVVVKDDEQNQHASCLHETYLLVQRQMQWCRFFLSFSGINCFTPPNVRFLSFLSFPDAGRGFFMQIKKSSTVEAIEVVSYLISCSKASKSGVLKNSPKVISKPSQSFLIVMAPGF